MDSGDCTLSRGYMSEISTGYQFQDPRHKSMQTVKGFTKTLRTMEEKDKHISLIYQQQDKLISLVEDLVNNIDCEEQELPPVVRMNLMRLIKYIQSIDNRARSKKNAEIHN